MNAASSRAYRFCLRLLPSAFRDEFADEMTTVFLDQRQRALGVEVLGLWLTSIGSLLSLSARLRADQVRLDLRDAVRSLIRQKTFTITSTLTLALAFGPATAVFSLVNGVLLDPIPGVNVDRLVYVWMADPERNRHEYPWSELNFQDTRERQRGFSALAAFVSTTATFGGDSPQQISGSWASVDLFDALGVKPSRGRAFQPQDHEVGAPPVILLAEDFARQRFGDRDPIGQTLRVDGSDTIVIGILPRGLRFPSAQTEFWQPLIINRATSTRGSNYLSVIARIAPGVDPADALQSIKQIARDLVAEYPTVNGNSVEFVPAADQLTRAPRRIVNILGLAAIAILLLACTNIASLLVVRTAGRQNEFSVRTALGASGSRLRRQLLVEHLVLSAIAAVVGVSVASGLLKVLAVSKLISESHVERAAIGPIALTFLIGLVAVTSTGIGWAVSRRASRASLANTARGESSSREVVRLRQLLVSTEVGAAVILLVAAALLIQSASKLLAVEHGFQAENVIKFQVGMPAPKYADPAVRLRFLDDVVAKLREVPGVRSAASAAFGPMGEMRSSRRYAIDGRPLPEPGKEPQAVDLPAGPGYAETVGLKMIDGRWISERDGANAPPVVVVSEAFARQNFPGERAVGRRLRFYSGRPNQPPPPMPEIVGVVSDVRQYGMAEQSVAQMYMPQTQRVWGFTSFFVRTYGDPRAVLGSLEGAVRSVDPERPLEQVRTFAELIDASTADRRALSALLLAAALVALLISTIGVYGVAAATTEARRRELAIRAAIGADRRGLLRLVVRRGMVAAAVGVIAGVAGGMAVSRVLDAVLFNVESRDPFTFGLVGLVLLAVSWLASYVPARRAATVNPAEALRAE